MNHRPDKARLDELLDDALAETFPASDPVSAFCGDAPSRHEGEDEADPQDADPQAVEDPGQDERRPSRMQPTSGG